MVESRKPAAITLKLPHFDTFSEGAALLPSMITACYNVYITKPTGTNVMDYFQPIASHIVNLRKLNNNNETYCNGIIDVLKPLLTGPFKKYLNQVCATGSTEYKSV